MRPRRSPPRGPPADGRSYALALLDLAAQLGHGQALERKEDEADADAQGRLDQLEPDREREGEVAGNRVKDGKAAGRGALEDAEVARRDREELHQVRRQEDDPGRTQALVDAVCL